MMLKFFFWILLLANTGVGAYQLGYFDELVSNGREPGRLGNQFNTDRLQLIPPPPDRQVRAEPPGKPAVQAARALTNKADKVLACAEIGNFNTEDARRFQAEMATLAFADRLTQREIPATTSHIVYIPPQADREGTEKKADELRALGIDEFFIIQDSSSLHGAISLGVFRQESAARTHLSRLRKQGVRTARVGQRSSSLKLVAFQLHGLDAKEQAALEQVTKDFSRQKMRDCTEA